MGPGGKLALKVTEDWIIFRLAVMLTSELSAAILGLLAVTVANPIETPRTLPLAETAPAGIVMVGVTGSSMDGSLLTNVTTTPPGGAGFGASVTGKSVVWPSGTFNVAGVLRRFGVTVTSSVPSVEPVALARTVIVPGAMPFTVTWPVVTPAGMKAVSGDVTVRTPVSSLVTVTVTPSVGAGLERVIPRVAERPTPTTLVPIRANVMSKGVRTHPTGLRARAC